MEEAIDLVRGPSSRVGPDKVLRGAVVTEALCHVSVPARRLEAVGRSDGFVSVWRPRNAFSHEIAHIRLRGHGGAVNAAVFAEHEGPRGLLITGSADSTVRVWDPFAAGDGSPAGGGGGGGGGGGDEGAAAAGAAAELCPRSGCVQTLSGRHGGSVTAVALARGSVVSASNDGTVCVWTCAAERSSAMLYPFFMLQQTIDGFGGRGVWVTALGVRDGTLFVGDSSGSVHVYSRPSHHSRFSFVRRDRMHALGVCALRLVPQQNYLVTASFDCTFKVHDLLSGQGVYGAEAIDRGSRYTAAAFLPGMDLLALGTDTGRVQLWSVPGECVLLNERVSSSPVTALRVKDGCGRDTLQVAAGGAVTEWTVRRQRRLCQYAAHTAAVVSLRLLPDGSLFSASCDGTLRCFDPFDMACLSFIEVRAGGAEVTCMCVANESGSVADATSGAEGAPLAVAGLSSGAVATWSTDSGMRLGAAAAAAGGGGGGGSGHADLVTALAEAGEPLRGCVLSVSYDGRLGLWREGALVVAVQACEQELLAVAWDPVRRLALVGGNAGSVAAWSVGGTRNGCVSRVGGGEGAQPVTALAVDAGFVLAGREDGTVEAIEAGLGFVVASVRAHTAPVRQLLVLPGGYVASCATDGRVAVWDYSEGRVAQEFVHESRRFTCMALGPPAPEGVSESLYAGTESGSIASLALSANALPRMADARAGRRAPDLLRALPPWEEAPPGQEAPPGRDYTVRLPLDGLGGGAREASAQQMMAAGRGTEGARARASSLAGVSWLRRGRPGADKPPPSPRSQLRRALSLKEVVTPRGVPPADDLSQ